MLKTKDCVAQYVDEMLNFGVVSKTCRANSCEGVYRYFVSYSTPICEYREDGKFYLSTKKYSTTTSKLQNLLRKAIPTDKLEEVYEIRSNLFPFAR